MTPAELLSASDHLAVCPTCCELAGRNRFHPSFISLRSDLRSEATVRPTHLGYEQLAAFIDETADEVDREIALSHLEICPSCETEAQNLRSVRSETINAGATATVGERTRLWGIVSAFRKRSRYRVPFQLAAASLAALLLVWIATLPQRREIAELRAKLEQAEQKNTELQEQTSVIEELRAQLSEMQRSQVDSSRESQTLRDAGLTLSVDSQGNIAGLEPLPPDIEQALKAALNNTHPEVSDELRSLIGKSGVLLGGHSEGISFPLTSPVGTVVKSDRPTFRWQRLPGATSYAVDVFDSQMKNVARADRLSVANWTPSLPLERNQTYTWQVTAARNNEEISSPMPPAPAARFKVLESSKAEDLNRASKAHPDSHLLLGALYQKAGLLDDAEREFQLLLSANPNSPVARRLLQKVKSLRQK
jgi:tetratricopeptide (TPR) repeat protein